MRLRRKVEIGSGSSDATRPVVVIETWIEFARLAKVRPSAGSWGQGNDRVEKTQKSEVKPRK